MVVAIKNFKMPKSCHDCSFCEDESDRCLADVEHRHRYTEGYADWDPGIEYPNYILQTHDVKIGKPEWCPLYEISEQNYCEKYQKVVMDGEIEPWDVREMFKESKGEVVMTLREFLLHKTKAEELCVICDPWICATVWIDHEDLFIAEIMKSLLECVVLKDEWKDFYMVDENGVRQEIRAHYIYVKRP